MWSTVTGELYIIERERKNRALDGWRDKIFKGWLAGNGEKEF